LENKRSKRRKASVGEANIDKTERKVKDMANKKALGEIRNGTLNLNLFIMSATEKELLLPNKLFYATRWLCGARTTWLKYLNSKDSEINMAAFKLMTLFYEAEKKMTDIVFDPKNNGGVTNG
jgi:hypothetical protein